MTSKLTRQASQVAGRLKRLFADSGADGIASPGPRVTQREMVGQLARIPHWERKIEFLSRYDYSERNGAWLEKTHAATASSGAADALPIDAGSGFAKINYGCGSNLMAGWLNVDLFQSDAPNYRFINLLEKHPFPDKAFNFGFSEDVLEHLNQAESIFFLSEIYRTLAEGGIVRLSFPGLEGVLERHYTPVSETTVRRGEFEAYSFWDHIHFYSKDELVLVAKHIGFKQATFVEYGKSEHPELAGLDTRSTQIGLNTYAELTK